MKRWMLYTTVILLLTSVSFLFGFSQHKNKQLNLKGIDVIFNNNKATFLTTSMVNKLLKQSEKNLLNKVKSEINLYELEESVEKDKMIENAEVFFTPSGILKAHITQRVPIARIKNASSIYYLDRQGFAMPLSPNYSARVPLVTGIQGMEMEKEVFELIQILKNDAFYKKQIVGIHRKKKGDYVLNIRVGKHKVLLGRPKSIVKKMKKLKVFYKKEWESETLKNYQLINLKYNHQVICS